MTQTQVATTVHTTFALTASWQAVPSFITCLVHPPVMLVTSAFPCRPSLGPTPPPSGPHFCASAAPRHLRRGLTSSESLWSRLLLFLPCLLSYFSSDGRAHVSQCPGGLLCQPTFQPAAGVLLGPPSQVQRVFQRPPVGFVNLCVRAKNPNILEIVIRVCLSFYFAHMRIDISPFHAVHTHRGIARICPFIHLSIYSLFLCECVSSF